MFNEDYYLAKITSLEIAEEIVHVSNMDEKTRRICIEFLAWAKNGDMEAEDLLKRRLAGWLAKQTY